MLILVIVVFASILRTVCLYQPSMSSFVHACMNISKATNEPEKATIYLMVCFLAKIQM